MPNQKKKLTQSEAMEKLAADPTVNRAIADMVLAAKAAPVPTSPPIIYTPPKSVPCRFTKEEIEARWLKRLQEQEAGK